jgi:cellulose synthase/poly-beta-1,6-N-acetylglucosamine synthase-like glycosyltransferase
MFFIVLFGWLIAGGLALLLLVLGLECLLALIPQRSAITSASASAAVLIPAHNEALGIARTLELLKPEVGAADRILVVADNCNDATASIAGEHGVEVLERFHNTNRGKGFALEAGVRYLEANSPPDVVVILDADCELEPGSLGKLKSTCASAQLPVQAKYLMRLPAQAGPEFTVSAFAFLVKNWVRPRALRLLKLPVHLTGTGMAIPWAYISHAPLATNEIVEDLALGLYFTLKGYGPVGCDEAGVWSELPCDAQVAVSQRTRWEHGYLSSILRDVPVLITTAIRQMRPSLLIVALDLMIPPLALLGLISLFATALLFLFGFWSGNWYPLLTLLGAGLFAILGVAVAWLRFGRELIPANMLFAIPKYVWSKIAIYKRFVTHRQKEWVRTERN